MIPAYSSPFQVEHRAVRGEIFLDSVLVQEKVDGSQISFGLIGGELKIRSKGAQIHLGAPNSMFFLGVEAIKAVQDKLVPGFIYRGEYLNRPKHNVLAYDRVPKNHIALFDIEDLNLGDESYVSPSVLQEEAYKLGFETVPVLCQGRLGGWRDLNQYMDLTSFLGGANIEGVVVKNYNRFTPDKKVMMAKLVAAEFKEVHRGEFRKDNPTPTDIKNQIVSMYRTPARWQKAVIHLKEKDQLTNSVKDIGPLIKEVYEDIDKECKEEMKNYLYDHFRKDLLRGCVYGLPEWYKEKTLNEPI